jgi:hypothetical protein
MAFVSVTRLRLRSWRFVPGFAVQAIGSFRQSQRAPGFKGGSVLQDRRLTFWTLTLWDGMESMRAYILSGPHRTAMPRLVDWCDEASVVHWEQGGPALPTWAEAEGRMRAEGRPSKVRHPSPDHATLAFRPARTITGAPITPARKAGST